MAGTSVWRQAATKVGLSAEADAVGALKRTVRRTAYGRLLPDARSMLPRRLLSAQNGSSRFGSADIYDAVTGRPFGCFDVELCYFAVE